MREIKFQVLVIKHKLSNLVSNMHWAGIDSYEEIIDVYDISFDNGKIDYVTDKDGDEYSFTDKSLKAVRQYTGLKDKNGREIYEGDIIQTSYMKIRGCAYRCVFSAEFGGYLFDPFVIGDKDAPLLGIEEFAQQWEEVKHGEVIGNIYENPKLLSN
ncbi:YopX family protein [Bacillus halotolerans]|uniref:YopX family protein n=1 Tax=Bacillus halotolerans TaxID=260554 RepID=UPI0020C548C3|nr:YopX family protein [Bacillus halotolerans]UTL74838.1 YopX family protein [Bacillus halotolerans]